MMGCDLIAHGTQANADAVHRELFGKTMQLGLWAQALRVFSGLIGGYTAYAMNKLAATALSRPSKDANDAFVTQRNKEIGHGGRLSWIDLGGDALP